MCRGVEVTTSVYCVFLLNKFNFLLRSLKNENNHFYLL
nr:MAG TPA: ms48, ms51, ms56, ms59, ms60, translation, Trypanosoma, large ribosomal [Caudoviricetes sp.]